MKALELTLRFENSLWTIKGEGFSVRDTELNEAERKLQVLVKKKFPGQPVEIRLRFDMQSIPRWFHQYQNHYFNTVLYVN